MAVNQIFTYLCIFCVSKYVIYTEYVRDVYVNYVSKFLSYNLLQTG